MQLINKIKNNSLLIIPSKMKERIVSEITKLDGLMNIKYTSFEEIEKRIYHYDKEAIYYLMNKYNYKYDVACVYLESIRYIEEKVYNNTKLDALVKLKKELHDNNLIIYNDIENYQYENIIIYGYTYINNYRKEIINKLKDNYNIIYLEDNELNKNNKIYEFSTIKDEIVYVAESICSLISNNIDISKIKLIVEDKSYYKIINNIFSLFNLKTTIKDKTSINITTMGKFFLDNIEDDINLTLDKIRNNFDMNKQNNILVYNKIIKLINNYNNKNILKYLIEYDLKSTYLDPVKYTNEIEVLSIYNSIINEDDYVFLLGFNQKIIPRINKDEGFFSDIELTLLNQETSVIRNKLEKEALIKRIKSINNLIITYKLHDNTDTYLISTLNEELNYEIIKDKNKQYLYSNKYNKLKLSILIDKLVKYGIHDNSLDILYNTYPDVNYLTYDNTYKQIDKNDLSTYLDNKLLLSYTSLTNYFECSFKYYLANILKLVPYEKTYMSLIGDVFHYILSICFDKDIDFEKEYDKYLKDADFELDAKENFFFNKLKGDLLFIINTIKEQYKHTSFNNAMYEEKVIVEKDIDDIHVTFMGVIDKLMYKKYEDKELLAIIDYKTGNPEINLNNIVYGLDMQLPIYLYLAKNSNNFNNPIIVGFYLQKLLSPEALKDYKKDYLLVKKDKLKLNGYSVDDQNLLEEFDDSFNKSAVIKSMATTSSGSFSNYAKVLSRDNIDKLTDIISNNINKATDNIINAKFDINPKVIGKDNKGCKFCMFYDICYLNPKDRVVLDEVKDVFEEVK